MIYIVDTNVLFSFFWKNSVTRQLMMNENLELFSPEYALKEINKYKNEIIQKANVTEKEFVEIRKELAIAVNFIPIEEYKDEIKKIIDYCPDKNDVDFFALTLNIRGILWSNNSKLKEQEEIIVFSTKEVIDNLDVFE